MLGPLYCKLEASCPSAVGARLIAMTGFRRLTGGRRERRRASLYGRSSSGVPSFQLRLVFGAVSSRVSSGDAMSRFVGFGDKNWDNSKNFFQTQGFEFSFLSQRPRLAAFGGSIAPKTPVLKLKRLLACKPPAAIASESTRAAFMLVEKPQVAALRRPRVK